MYVGHNLAFQLKIQVFNEAIDISEKHLAHFNIGFTVFSFMLMRWNFSHYIFFFEGFYNHFLLYGSDIFLQTKVFQYRSANRPESVLAVAQPQFDFVLESVINAKRNKRAACQPHKFIEAAVKLA
jgi:hypothetical protein